MKNWFDWRFRRNHHHHKYEPFYDEHSDYNTNAKSYYDYLARFNRHIRYMTEFINRLMNRNIKFKDTNTVSFLKKGDWIENGDCNGKGYDDEIEVSAKVILSKGGKEYTVNGKKVVLKNELVEMTDGVYSPDTLSVLSDIYTILKDHETKINDNKKQIDINKTNIANNTKNIKQVENNLQKIIDNLFKSGAITSKDPNDFEFVAGRDIASGNINLFGGVSDGQSFIKTSNKKTENDISAGY